MKKLILLLAVLNLVFHVNSQVTWTVINNTAVATGAAVGAGNSGNLQFCLENAAKGDIITFDASLSGATINFGNMGTGAINIKPVRIDASALANPVIFDGQNSFPIIKSINSFSTAGDTLRFKNIIFQNGKATASAGVGALESREHLIVENCKFINNTYTLTTGDGVGGIKMGARNAYVRLSDCLFQNNSSGYRGGALWFPSNKSLIERCYFTGNQTGNQANSVGAVLYVATGDGPDADNTYIEFKNCTMVNNYSAKANHGIIISNTNTNITTRTGSKLRFINCTIYGNALNGEAGSTIAAIYTVAHKIEIGGCLMANNNASDIRTNTSIIIESLGYNTYHEIHQRTFDNTGNDFESTSKQATDIKYDNSTWVTTPLAAAVNSDGVMIPKTSDSILFHTNIQRIPVEKLTAWHGANPVDQMGRTRTALSSVGAYHSSAIITPPDTTVTDTTKTFTIYGIGDSTMANQQKYTPGNKPHTGWGEVFGDYFNEFAIVDDRARNGRSTASFISEGLWSPIVTSLKKGDYVFIQFGHNDEKGVSLTDFRTNLAKFVRDTRFKGAIPVLLTPITRRTFSGNTLSDSHGDYPGVMRTLAADSAVYLIDMHQKSMTLVQSLGVEGSKAIFLWLNPGDHPNYPTGVQDNTHLSPYGAHEISKLVILGIRELNITPLISNLKTSTKIETVNILEKGLSFSNNKLHITQPQKGVLSLINLSGVIIKSLPVNELSFTTDFSFLEKGIYFAQYRTDKMNVSIKILKN